MRILELVFQGVAGSPELTRVKLGAGVTLLRPGAAGLPIGRLLTYALYDESVEPPADLRDPQASASRVAVTLQDHAGSVYRIIRDLSTGAVQLAKYQPASKSFDTVSSRPSEAGQYLRSQARLAPEDLFRDLLWLDAARLPSRWVQSAEPGRAAPKKRLMPVMGGAAAAAHYQAQAASAGQSHGVPAPALARSSALDQAAAASPLGGRPDPFAGVSLEARREKLADLERRKSALEETDDLQFTLEGKQRALFEIEEKRKKLTQLEREAQGLKEALEAQGELELDEDAPAKLKEYSFLSSRLEKTLTRIESDRRQVEERLADPIAPPQMDRLFQAGAGAVALFSVAGLLFEPARWLLFLNPAALGVIAFVLLEWIGELESHHGVDAKRAALDERAEQATRQFEMETTGVRLLMSRLGVETVDAITQRLAAREKAALAYQAARSRLEEARKSPELASLDAARQTAEKEIAEIEGRLLQSGTAGISPMDLLRDIEALRASIDRTESGGSEAAFGGGSASADPGSEAEALPAAIAAQEPEGPVMPDPAPTLLSRLGDALLTSSSEAGDRLEPRVGQFAGALTSGRWTGVGFHGKGGTMVIGSPGGTSASWEQLSAFDRDMVFLALRLAFAEAVVRVGAQPLLFEGPFDAPGCEPIRPVLAKIVRHLGGLCPALHLTLEPAWAEHSDTVISLSETG